MKETLRVNFAKDQMEVTVGVGNPPRREIIVFDGTKSVAPDLSALWWESPSALPALVDKVEQVKDAHRETSTEARLATGFTNQTKQMIEAGKTWPVEG